MNEERLERIENHLVQLIQMVAENNHGLVELRQRFDGLEQRFDAERELNRNRHQEVMKEIRNQHFENDYLRNQLSKHDVEIHKLKMAQTQS